MAVGALLANDPRLKRGEMLGPTAGRRGRTVGRAGRGRRCAGGSIWGCTGESLPGEGKLQKSLGGGGGLMEPLGKWRDVLGKGGGNAAPQTRAARGAAWERWPGGRAGPVMLTAGLERPASGTACTGVPGLVRGSHVRNGPHFRSWGGRETQRELLVPAARAGVLRGQPRSVRGHGAGHRSLTAEFRRKRVV